MRKLPIVLFLRLKGTNEILAIIYLYSGESICDWFIKIKACPILNFSRENIFCADFYISK